MTAFPRRNVFSCTSVRTTPGDQCKGSRRGDLALGFVVAICLMTALSAGSASFAQTAKVPTEGSAAPGGGKPVAPPKGVSYLTETECTNLGGKVAPTTNPGICNSGKACTTQ